MATAEPEFDCCVEEINRLKEILPGQVRVIKDLGEFKYVINVHPEGLDLTFKFQLTEEYPQVAPNIIVKFGHKAEGADDLSHRMAEKSRHYVGSPMIEQLVDFALELIDTMGLDVETPEKTSGKKKHKGRKKLGKGRKKADEDEKEDKKVSMKTAEDVISRIMWDESLPTDQFTVGYMDRFIGMVEKNFSAFSWEDIASVDYTVLAIPKHRIHYFKYKDVTVWDKDKRMDIVFGSAGGNITIRDVIEQYEAERRDSEQAADGHGENDVSEEKDENGDSDDWDDDSDDGIQITIGTASDPTASVAENTQDVNEMLRNYAKGSNQDFWEDKLRPNYFLAVRVTDPEIVKQVEIVRNGILEKEPLYKDCCIPNSALHITLCVIRLDTEENVANAVEILNKAKTELAAMAPVGKTLRLEGVSHFYDRVIYAKVHYPPEFLEFVDHLKLCLWEGGVSNKDGYEFVPHMTVMKVSRPVARMKGTTKVKPSLFAQYSDLYFGTQSIDGVHLCSMGDARREDGFYITATSLKFVNDVNGAISNDKVHDTNDVMLSDSDLDEGAQNETDETPNVKTLSLSDRIRSNFFLSINIADPDIIRNVERLQQHMNTEEPVFQDFCLSANALHITFGTVLLETPEDVVKATELLKAAEPEFSKIVAEDDPIVIEGLGVFFDRIVYAKVHHSPAFLQLLSRAVKCLNDGGFVVREKESYVPHLTVLRVSRQDARVRNLKKVEPTIFNGFADMKFGSQIITTVNLIPVGRLK